MNLLRRLLMPDCERVRKVLQSYLDGELDERHARTVAAHLEHCDRCDIERDVYEQVKSSLQDLRQPPDPEALARLQSFAATLRRIAPNARADGGQDDDVERDAGGDGRS
ncbi:MAG: zf-HC2 domain-containing protein [Nitriliruptoraceae bacterium]